MYFLFVVVPLFYIGVIHCTYVQLTLIELSPRQSFILLVQFFQTHNDLLAFRRRWRYFMIGSSISCFIDMNFVLSATTNLSSGLIFFMIWLIFSSFFFFSNCTYFFHCSVIHFDFLNHRHLVQTYTLYNSNERMKTFQENAPRSTIKKHCVSPWANIGYSPDLTPSDFHLFPSRQIALNNKNFLM